MNSSHTPETNIQSLTTTRDSPFKPLKHGYEHLTEYECICEKCEGVYYRRLSITPSNLVDNERTPCECLRAELSGREHVKAGVNVSAELEQLFGPWNLVKGDAGYRLAKCKPETDEHKKLIINLNTYIQRFEQGVKGICFFGLAGRGKTHYATCVGNEIRDRGFTVLGIKSIDLLNRLKKCYASKDSEQELQVMKVLKNVDLLFIDDIGTEKPSGWVKEKLYEVIDYRFNKNTTIFTTNFSGQDLADKLGQALASRIYGAGYQVSVSGRDRRMGNLEDFSDIGREITELELEMRRR